MRHQGSQFVEIYRTSVLTLEQGALVDGKIYKNTLDGKIFKNTLMPVVPAPTRVPPGAAKQHSAHSEIT